MNHILRGIRVPILLILLSSCTKQQPDVRIIPEPARIEIGTGLVRFPADPQLYLSSSDSSLFEAGKYLADKLGYSDIRYDGIHPQKGVFLAIGQVAGSANPEAYTLTTSPGSVLITGNSARGVFYGIQTLLQLLPPEVFGPEGLTPGKRIRIPEVSITDEPRFKWRGMHLDVGRHLFPVDFIKRYIDVLALHKFNVFHWHLTEDQGWRIEIKKYPRLTETGSKRTQPDGTVYGGYYTQDEIRDVVKYAKSRFVDVMPEIEMPGHAVAALAAYPGYSCTGGPFEVRTKWGVAEDVYCAGKDSTFGFVEDILSEVIALFPFEYVHIGGDECPKVRWKACPDCQKRIRTEGLKDEMELQSYFIRRVEKFLGSKNRRLVGWDEILEGGLAPEATVMSWRGVSGGIEAAKQGHDVIMSPTSHCYFDFYQGDPRFEPKAIGGFIPLEKVYSYEPVPDELSATEAVHVLGAQANVWTEYIPTVSQVEYMALPRMSALAEVVWTPKELRDFEKFQFRMEAQYRRFDAMNLNYRIPPPTVLNKGLVFTDSLLLELAVPLLGAEVRYSADGADPKTAGRKYESPVEFNHSATVKAVTVMPGGRAGNAIEILVEKQEMLLGFALSHNISNGVDFEVYDGTFSSVKEVGSSNVKDRGSLPGLMLPDPVPQMPFGLILRGYLKAEVPGVYRFYLKSDDGSVLTIGDRVAVDDDGLHAANLKSGDIALGKGWHMLELKYFDAGGARSLQVDWSGPGFDRQPVPEEKLASLATPMMMTPVRIP